MKKEYLALTKLLVSSIAMVAGGCASTNPSRGIDAVNYAAAEALRANETVTGVVVAMQPVDVTVPVTESLLAGLAYGVTDILVGTRLGVTEVEAFEYVIRLDNPRNLTQRNITVVQVKTHGLVPGRGVAVTRSADTRSVRVVPIATPEMYAVLGLEEERWQDARERGFKRDARTMREAWAGVSETAPEQRASRP